MGAKPDFDDVSTVDEAPAQTALVVFRPATLVAFSDGILDAVEKVAAEARARVAGADVSTAEGREVIRSTAYKVARSKTALDDLGAELVAEQKRTAAAVDASRRDMRGKLDALKDEVRKPLTDFEAAEERRVAGHEAELARIEQLLVWPGFDESVEEAEARLATLNEMPQREWQEFKQRANDTIVRVHRGISEMIERRKKAERDALELARLQREVAEREQRERDERIAREAAERARKAAEEAAAAEQRRRDEEAAAIQRRQDAEKRELAESVERLSREAEEAGKRAEEAAARAVAEEQARAAAAKAAEDEAARKRESNKRHLAKINREIVDVLCALIPELSPELAKAVVTQIALGKFDRVKISY